MKYTPHNVLTSEQPIPIGDIESLTEAEYAAVSTSLDSTNMAFYQTDMPRVTEDSIERLATQFGITEYEHTSKKLTKIRNSGIPPFPEKPTQDLYQTFHKKKTLLV